MRPSSALWLCVALAGCGGWGGTEPVTPAPSASSAPSASRVPVQMPTVSLRTERPRVKSPLASPLDERTEAARQVLWGVVHDHARDPQVGWKLSHALVGLGADATFDDGSKLVDRLVSGFVQRVQVGDEPGIRMPRSKNDAPADPHFAQSLSVLASLGLPPDYPVQVEGTALTLRAMYRTLLFDVWVDDGKLSPAMTSYNDTPWALSAIAAWASPHMAWQAQGGHRQSLDALTDAIVAKLVEETRFLAQARAADQMFQKRGQGIFAYTCGGAHFLQGAATAVGLGFGHPADRDVMVAQASLAAWRFPREVAIIDTAMKQAPQLAVKLLSQRLKTVGHYLETLHTFAGLGLAGDDLAKLRESESFAREKLVETVGALTGSGAFDKIDEFRVRDPQLYLDLIGDSAHALHGLELARGVASVWEPVAQAPAAQ